MCLCKQTGRMFESLVWKTVLNDCFTQALSAWFSWCVSQLLAPRLLSIAQMLPRSFRGKSNESFRQSVHNRLGSDLRLSDADWNNSGFKIQNYLALEPGSWDLTLAKRIQALAALRIQSLRPRGLCADMGLQNPSPTDARKSFFKTHSPLPS